MEAFVLAFIPLFVAIDPLGITPIYLALVEAREGDARTLLVQALGTAVVLATAFLLGGKLIFHVLGITADDFRIAGGLLLVLMSISDLLFSQYEQRRSPDPEAGIVPLGIPLIMGPAALTTIIINVDNHGYGPAVAALVVNLLIVYLLFSNGQRVLRLVGRATARATSKLISVLLAAIGVMMIRQGITNLLAAN